MEIVYENFVQLGELSDQEMIKKRLAKYDELIVIENNVPLFIISNMKKHVESKREELDTLLSKVGKRMFIEYFTIFRDYNKSEDVLPMEYSLSSRRLRASSAKSIFKKGLELEALRLISSSVKLDNEIKNKAKNLLELYGVEVEESKPLSYVAKNVIPLLLNEPEFRDEIIKFTTRDYTKEVFSMYYPLLVHLDEYYDIESKIKDSNRYPRYYNKPIIIEDERYLLCSQWNKKVQEKKVYRYIVNYISKLIKGNVDSKAFVFAKYKDFLPKKVLTEIENTIEKGDKYE